MTEEQRTELELELTLTSIQDTLTEVRYNQILDALLPTLSVPDAVGTLMGFGEQAWQERRVARERSVQAA